MQAEQAVDPATPLTWGQPYYFWLEIGPPVARSIMRTLIGPPGEVPAEARLKVALFAFDNELQVTPGADMGELQLRPDGTVRVVRQPAELPTLPPESDLPVRRLYFPVRAPWRTGVLRLRCNIYYEQVLVQSRLIRVRVMRQPWRVPWAPRSVVDYNIARTLDPAHLSGLVPHQLSVMLNSNGDGTHGFRLFGANEFKSDATFDGHQLEALIQQARGGLRLATWGEEAPWKPGKDYRYRYGGAGDRKELRADLVDFAKRGYHFYDAIVNKLAGGAAKVDELEALMLKPGFVQIANKQSARFILPAAMIYDYGFDTSADDYTLCPAFLAALDRSASLEELGCFQGACPSRGEDTVICPSGFWGYRHYLGMPLSLAAAPEVPAEMSYEHRPLLTVSVSTDPLFTQRSAHEQALQALRKGDLGWSYADKRDETFRLLKETKPHLIYFYCHGGIERNAPYIEVGPPNRKNRIFPDSLRWKRIRWDTPRPLVFINGCRTTALEPEQALEFVSAFVETAGASGVIGTEITIFEPLARAFAEECLSRFLAGASIGEAVRGARLALLKAGNPLGLVYIPFVIASLHLMEHGAIRVSGEEGNEGAASLP